MGPFSRLLKWTSKAAQLATSAPHANTKRKADRRLVCEELEIRSMLSATVNVMPFAFDGSPFSGKNASPSGLSVNQVRAAYGLGTYTSGVLSNGISFGGISGDGRGQTIAIVDAFDYPTALNDLNAFSRYYGLPTFNGAGGPTFKTLTQTGQAVSESRSSPNYVATDPNDSWEGEESMDIEWAHAIAPMANISLYEANNDSDNLANLFTAVHTAASTTGVVAVSMSWDVDDNTLTAAQAAKYDSTDFKTPSGHIGGSATINGAGLAGGVTFLAAAGDNGPYDYNDDPNTIMPEYPTDSPNVVSVGGTSLTVDGGNPNYTYGSETAWGDGVDSGTDGGGGGGVTLLESQPSYQKGVVSAYSTTNRTFPDVSLDADPDTGVAIYDSYDNGTARPWSGFNGGTSLSTPMFAGVIAVADEGRAMAGEGSLDGPTQTLPDLYKLPSTDFHDITTGSTGSSPKYEAVKGYDLATGLGSPVANKLVPGLVANASTTTAPTVAKAASASTIGGTTVSLSVLGADASTGEASLRYTWVATSVPSGLALPTFSINGTNASKNTIVTFKQAGTYRFTVTIATATGPSVTSTVSVTVNQTQTSIAVSPSPATLLGTVPQQFDAVAKDQFGIAMATQPAFTWTTTVGKISTSGLLTPPAAPASGTVTAASGSFRGTATFNVVSASSSAVVMSDSLMPGKTSLFVTGTSTNDVILIMPAGTAGAVLVEINGQSVGTFSPTGRIVVRGSSAQGYTDYVDVSSKVTLPTWIYGDSGKDELIGGGGPNIIVGGFGSAALFGGVGRNILIAGTGTKSLIGGTGDSLLVGGTTAFSSNDLALLSIMNEWNSADNYTNRVAYITGKAGGQNGSYYFDSATVTGAAADTLLGGSGNDVFFASSSDKLSDRTVTETLISIS